MKLLFVLLVLTACAIAHNGARTHARRAQKSPIKDVLKKLMSADPVAQYLSMNFQAPYEIINMDRGRIPNAPIDDELTILNEEIKINLLPEKSEIRYKPESEILVPYIMHPKVDHKDPAKPLPSNAIDVKGGVLRKLPIKSGKISKVSDQGQPRFYDKEEKQNNRNTFAWTPLDREYFTTIETSYSFWVYGRECCSCSRRSRLGINNNKALTSNQHISSPTSTTNFNRAHRQNPNLSRDKTLVTELDKLKKQLAKHGMRFPLTLIPQNMNWLKISPAINRNSSDNGSTTAEAQEVFGVGDMVYLVFLSTSIAAAVIVPTLIILYGVYNLMKRAKAGSVVEYPTYGVTGPSVDSYGDHCLAHSAEMFHYHHQKQQIIAMEGDNNEQRNGSLSDPESEENEEGEYTVYECPGFATTGEMEVKNPLFDEATPATPGKVQVVQTQLTE